MAIGDHSHIEETVRKVWNRRYVTLPNGSRKHMTGEVTVDDALRIVDMITEHKCSRCVETGVAYGMSTLAICAAIDSLNQPGAVHVGIDPQQLVEHEGAAIALLREYGLEHRFRLLEGPAHLMTPTLLAENTTFDFALIDGWHTFDYVLLDFFFFDKLLRPGGIVAFHDTTMPAVRKTIEFAKRHRRYLLLPFPRVSLVRSAYRTLKCVARRDPYVRYPLTRRPNLLFLQKVSDWEPRWDYFKNF